MLMDRRSPLADRASRSCRAAWARFVAAERRFSDSIWGDIVAGIGVAVLSVALVMLAGLLP